ncbi:hypothetical protein CWC46_06520 [Prodigiosinella confusarubida]|uniref:Uncharacterized protein n=1 Tax=Serratia sp. (strain ATCC 39006) TaxID=104623 RepID=A0A2I5TGW9_SERS3|nr:hypothetical protein [Serratia sp. ATCC 39006]AUG99503.1 hypothetical protein CWC46_06520 [Serratia sp. ATCC 39006]AUH03821.1 hypothetical protein Ser39006_006525 [Serratia sp. ATCC 39006]
MSELAEKINDFSRSMGWDISRSEVQRLIAGHAITFGDQPYIVRADGCLYRAPARKKNQLSN